MNNYFKQIYKYLKVNEWDAITIAIVSYTMASMLVLITLLLFGLVVWLMGGYN